MKIRYIGLFPPPYGGVTIKNKLIYDCLSETKKIVKFNRPRWMPRAVFQILNLMTGIIPNQALIIGVSAAGGKSKLVTKTLYFFARRNMNRSLYFMMGGQECYRIADNKEEIKWYSEYKKIYVETETMKKIMVEAGINNVEIFPNCRRKPKSEMRVQGERHKLRCVFFSNIQPEKGADIILEVAKGLHNIEFFFYGPIESKFDGVFKRTVSELENVHYMGIFKGTDEEKYKELRKYDVLLLPTRWKNEGVPGILVEAKIAGLAEIVSNQNYNSELVSDGCDGIVMNKTTAESLSTAILSLDENPMLLKSMQTSSWKSAEQYYIEKYVDDFNIQLRRVTKDWINSFDRERLKCVFFSLIQEKKGADIVLNAARNCPSVDFAFYGAIDVDYEKHFMVEIASLPNVQYHGLFKGSNEDVYAELAKYDVLLFPTKWKTEGVPGILVEGKIAGLAEVVSNESYNSEIVKDGVEGIVLKENTKECLVETILHLESNRGNLRKMQVCSKESAKRFFIETYLPSILCQLD